MRTPPPLHAERQRQARLGRWLPFHRVIRRAYYATGCPRRLWRPYLRLIDHLGRGEA